MYKFKRKSGNVTYVEKFKDPLTGKERAVSVTIKPSRSKRTDDRIAEEEIRKKISKLHSSSITNIKKLTLGQLCEKYIIRQKQEYKEQTAESSRMHLNTVRRLIGDDVIVNRLNATIVREKLWCDDSTTYNGRLKIFKAMMNWAYKADLVSDVTYLKKIPKRKTAPVRYKDADKYLEHDEIQILLDGMRIDQWKNLTEFLLLSGLRVGEAIALRDSDVDTKNRIIHVTKTYAAVTRKITDTPKTETSVRDVYMQDELLSICRRIKKFERQRQIKFVYRSDLFMSDLEGKHICYDSYAKYFREYTEKILGRRLTPHSLRHTHTALLAESGIPLEEISRRLGHADSKITKDVYMHVTEKMREQAEERIKNVKML